MTFLAYVWLVLDRKDRLDQSHYTDEFEISIALYLIQEMHANAHWQKGAHM